MNTRTASMRPQEVPPARRSARFSRAAAAERAALARRRELASRSEPLRGEREPIKITLIGLEERIALLDRLAELSARPSCSPGPDDGGRAPRLARRVLSGPAIRTITGRVLPCTDEPGNSAHHPQLFDIIRDARSRLRPSVNHDSELA